MSREQELSSTPAWLRPMYPSPRPRQLPCPRSSSGPAWCPCPCCCQSREELAADLALLATLSPYRHRRPLNTRSPYRHRFQPRDCCRHGHYGLVAVRCPSEHRHPSRNHSPTATRRTRQRFQKAPSPRCRCQAATPRATRSHPALHCRHTATPRAVQSYQVPPDRHLAAILGEPHSRPPLALAIDLPPMAWTHTLAGIPALAQSPLQGKLLPLPPPTLLHSPSQSTFLQVWLQASRPALKSQVESSHLCWLVESYCWRDRESAS